MHGLGISFGNVLRLMEPQLEPGRGGFVNQRLLGGRWSIDEVWLFNRIRFLMVSSANQAIALFAQCLGVQQHRVELQWGQLVPPRGHLK